MNKISIARNAKFCVQQLTKKVVFRCFAFKLLRPGLRSVSLLLSLKVNFFPVITRFSTRTRKDNFFFLFSLFFVDVNECLTAEAKCSGDRCRNTQGSYTCVPCLPGFTENDEGICVGRHAQSLIITIKRKLTPF